MSILPKLGLRAAATQPKKKTADMNTSYGNVLRASPTMVATLHGFSRKYWRNRALSDDRLELYPNESDLSGWNNRDRSGDDGAGHQIEKIAEVQGLLEVSGGVST